MNSTSAPQSSNSQKGTSLSGTAEKVKQKIVQTVAAAKSPEVIRTARQSLFRIVVKPDIGTSEAQTLYVQGVAPEQVKLEFRKKNYQVHSIQEVVSTKPVTSGHIRSAQMSMFCYQLGGMLEAGIALPRALSTILEGDNPMVFVKALSQIINDHEDGMGFAECLSRHPGIFDESTLAVIEAGEKTGELPKILYILADKFEKEAVVKNSLRAAFAYPSILMILGSVITGVLYFMVIPKFVALYQDLGTSLPWMTRVTIWISEFVERYWMVILVVLFGAGFFIWRYLKTTDGKLRVQSILLKLPGPLRVIRHILEKSSIALFSRVLALLVDAGETWERCLRLASQSATLEKHKLALFNMIDCIVKQGFDPPQALHAHYAFTSLFRQQFEVGHLNGNLPPMLTKLATMYENEVQMHIKEATAYVEPLILAFFGVVIGWIVISVYWPLFRILSVLGS